MAEALPDQVVLHTGAAQRRAIAKAITLLESTRTDHRAQADDMLTALLPHTGKAFRLGISGVPGVGKSTFIEVLGLFLIDKGHRVAVLTIDPSSTVSGGSILGDKTRMEKLSCHERAYIRPSPSSGTLGGVAEKTREAMLVCEAAGYDVVIVETVGVGQSEITVASMTDMFVLMQLPNAGDDLQAIKKGVMEIADLVVINKADLDPDAASRAQQFIASAMRLLAGHRGESRGAFTGLGGANGLVEDGNASPAGQASVPGEAGRAGEVGETGKAPAASVAAWQPKAMQMSALSDQGLDSFWASVVQFRAVQDAQGKLGLRRQSQALAWMWERIDVALKQEFAQNAAVRALLPQLQEQVLHGQLAASSAARQLLQVQRENRL